MLQKIYNGLEVGSRVPQTCTVCTNRRGFRVSWIAPVTRTRLSTCRVCAQLADPGRDLYLKDKLISTRQEVKNHFETVCSIAHIQSRGNPARAIDPRRHPVRIYYHFLYCFYFNIVLV